MGLPTLYLKPHGNDEDEDYIVVQKTPFKVGRHPDSDRQIFRPDVSSCHAIFLYEEDGWWVQDNKSTNGTFINGKEMTGRHKLNLGDVVHFATSGFQVVPSIEAGPEVVSTTILADPADIQGMVDLLKIVGEQWTFAHYQVIVNLADGKVFGWESLGRASASQGPIPPQRLFQLAHTSKVESKLSARFRDSCRSCIECQHCWPDTTGLYLFFNLHPTEINDPGFLRSLEQFSQSDIRKFFEIVVEMPETWVSNTDEMRVLVKQVRSLGMSVAYDDFGAGQSRIGDLINAPPDYLKLDRDLVANIQSNSVQRGIVAAIVDACGQLGVKTLAEGIETEEERRVCLEMNIDLGQGYLLGRPKPAYDLFSIDRTTLPATCPFVKLNLLPR